MTVILSWLSLIEEKTLKQPSSTDLIWQKLQ